jgi:hypothetical protein
MARYCSIDPRIFRLFLGGISSFTKRKQLRNKALDALKQDASILRVEEDSMKIQRSPIRLLLTLSFAAILSIPLFAATVHPERIGDRVTFRSEGYSFELDLRNLSCLLLDAESRQATIVSNAAFPSSRYEVNGELSEIYYPRLGIAAKIGFGNGCFTLELSSRKARTITWPSVPMEKKGTSLIWPHFEGNYIPLSDAIWTQYLASRKWNTTQNQYLPFWGIERGRHLLSYLVENPFYNEIAFRDSKYALQMDFTHSFPDNADLAKPIAFRLYLDRDASPITPAKHFRRYLQGRDAIVTLEDKMRISPLVSRLIGASHAYIWDGAAITMADIKPGAWAPLAKAIVEEAASGMPCAGRQVMRAIAPDTGNFDQISRQTNPGQYLRSAMARDLSAALRSSRLYDESVWPLATLSPQDRGVAERMRDGKGSPESELVRLNSRLLHTSFPEYLNAPSTWGNGVSTRMIDALAESGMSRFVLTCNGIENIELRPEIASYAAEKGYLIGPYDSYFEIQDPDAPEWPTAIFDRALYASGGIIRADGRPVKGFNGVGYYASPIAMRPYFDKRVAANFQKAPYSYYFLDCDAYGEFFADYRPGRLVSLSEDLAARVDRVRTIFENYKVPVGSEGGSYLFAGSLTVAQGVFSPAMNVMEDPDFEINEMSRYFLGRPFPADEPERFFSPALLKDRYLRLFFDPRFRLPLYEAVFHDSLVTTSHYGSPSLKFANVAETAALTEILYQVAPMYHFNLDYFEKIKGRIKDQVAVFEKTHSYSYRYALEEFEYLSDDREVQRTRFGDLELIANFGERDFVAEAGKVPARSVAIAFRGSGEFFVYRCPALAEDRAETRDIPILIAALSSAEWAKREEAALAISQIGVAAKASVPALIASLEDEEWRVRAAAAKAIANMEGGAAAAVPALEKALKDEEWQVRRPAAYALSAQGKSARAAVPALVLALDDEEWQVRRAAATALGNIGKGARAAIPGLRARLKDPELQVRMAVEAALKNMGKRY